MAVSEENWKSERDQLTHALDFETRDRIIDKLDRAAIAARKNGLREAALHLEDAHRALLEHLTFNSWDNGIWWFASMITSIRGMSAETVVPREYQRFLDAIPSARLEDDMTRSQLAFWYGKSDIRVLQGEEKSYKRAEMLMGAIALLIIAAALIYFSS